MGRRFQAIAFGSLLGLIAIACGSRVVPLTGTALGQGGQPLADSTTGTTGGATGTGTTGTGTSGTGGSGSTTGTGPVTNCRGGATDKGVTADTIKVGLVAAIGGSFRGQFTPNIEAVDAYLKMINAEEGGVCGRKFQLYVRDDGGQRDRDATAARELADDIGVFAFVGSVSAPDSDTGVSDVSAAERIPDFGFPLTYQRSESKYTYGVPGQLQKRLNGEGSAGQRWLIGEKKIKQIAVFWVAEALVSKAAAWSFETAAKRAYPDIKICFYQETSVSDLNFDQYAYRLKGACPASNGPLGVFTTMENNSNVRLAGAMRNQGVHPAAYSPTFTSYLQSFVRDDQGNPRPETEGAYIAIPHIPFERCATDSAGRPRPPCSHPELNRYVTALLRYHPGFASPGSWGGPGWGQADLFVRAVKACGANLTRVCVLEQVNAITSYTANGFLSPTIPRERKIYTADLLLQVHNGRFVEVRPDDKSGPPGGPDFWDDSELYDWWDQYCSDQKRDPNTYPNHSQIDTFVKC